MKTTTGKTTSMLFNAASYAAAGRGITLAFHTVDMYRYAIKILQQHCPELQPLKNGEVMFLHQLSRGTIRLVTLNHHDLVLDQYPPRFSGTNDLVLVDHAVYTCR